MKEKKNTEHLQLLVSNIKASVVPAISDSLTPQRKAKINNKYFALKCPAKAKIKNAINSKKLPRTIISFLPILSDIIPLGILDIA